MGSNLDILKSGFTGLNIHQNDRMDLMDRPVLAELKMVGYKAHNGQKYEPIF